MKLKYVFAIVLLFGLFACSDSSNKSFEGSVMDSVSSYSPTIPPGDEEFIKKSNEPDGKKPDDNNKISQVDEKIPQKIIKTATVSCEVDEYAKAHKQIQESVKKWKGYISSENESKSSYEIRNYILIRVPSEKFDTLMNELLTGTKNVDSKQINIADVTEEYVDGYLRLKNKRATQEQYLTLLKRANTIEEILRVNEYLRVLQEEIETKEGRLKYIDNQVSYSTISLTVYQKYYQDYGFLGKILEGLEGGWKGILAFLIFLAYIWPLWIIGAVLFILIRRKIKKSKQKTNNQ